MLAHIKLNHIDLEAIFLEKAGSKNLFSEAKKIVKREGYFELCRQISMKILRKIFPGAPQEWRSDDYYDGHAHQVIVVENFNGPDCKQRLEEIKPDIVVLGGARILRDHIIAIPRIGILNAHPGLLPKYRGVDVIPWAVLNGDDVGVSVHFIDQGIDTGRICIRKELRIDADDDIASLRRKAEELAGQLMAQTLVQIMQGGCLDTIANPKEEGQQYYKMSRKMLKTAEQKLREKGKFADNHISPSKEN